MKIKHIAIWVNDLEKIKEFYMKYFAMKCNEKYVNSSKNFSSYFLSFHNSETSLEIMHQDGIFGHSSEKATTNGLTHFAISVGGKLKVNELTELLRKDGYIIKSETRTTGDGYYESVVLDPERNNIEITE